MWVDRHFLQSAGSAKSAQALTVLLMLVLKRYAYVAVLLCMCFHSFSATVAQFSGMPCHDTCVGKSMPG